MAATRGPSDSVSERAPRRMRVLMVSKACVVGTYQSKLEALAAFPGMELTVVVPPYWREPGRVLRYEPLHTRGYRTLILPQHLNGRYHLHWYAGLTRVVERIQPDLVHIDEEPADVVAWQCQRAANLVGARTLFFTWQNILRRVPIPFRFFQQYVFDHASAAICGNQEAVRVVRAKGYRRITAVIPQFGFDERLFRPVTEPRVPGTRVRIGFAGRLVENKGADLLIRAARHVPGDVEIVIAGSGPEEPKLRALVDRLRLQSRVRFERNRPSADMPAFLQSLDILAVPSLTRPNWKEQFGRVVAEAMGCAVPVVVSSCGELPNVVGDGGLVVQEGDVDALAGALRRLIDDAALRQELGSRGRQRLLRRFTQRAIAASTHGLYARVLGHS